MATSRTDSQLAEGADVPEALTSGFSAAFWVGAAFALMSLIATFVMLRKEELQASPAGAPVA